ncbi:MAG: hypothetical protein WAX80_03575 [Minisyncoccia bacterium]
MAWYMNHHLRHRGRLVEVGSRYGHYNGATVVKGKPLNLADEYSRDSIRLKKLFRRSEQVKREIQEFVEAMDRHYS